MTAIPKPDPRRDDDGVPAPQGVDLSFLDDKNHFTYGPAIRAYLEEYPDPASIDRLILNAWSSKNRRSAGIGFRAWAVERLKQFGHVALVSAVVIAGDKGDPPTMPFADGILRRFTFKDAAKRKQRDAQRDAPKASPMRLVRPHTATPAPAMASTPKRPRQPTTAAVSDLVQQAVEAAEAAAREAAEREAAEREARRQQRRPR